MGLTPSRSGFSAPSIREARPARHTAWLWIGGSSSGHWVLQTVWVRTASSVLSLTFGGTCVFGWLSQGAVGTAGLSSSSRLPERQRGKMLTFARSCLRLCRAALRGPSLWGTAAAAREGLGGLGPCGRDGSVSRCSPPHVAGPARPGQSPDRPSAVPVQRAPGLRASELPSGTGGRVLPPGTLSAPLLPAPLPSACRLPQGPWAQLQAGLLHGGRLGPHGTRCLGTKDVPSPTPAVWPRTAAGQDVSAGSLAAQSGVGDPWSPFLGLPEHPADAVTCRRGCVPCRPPCRVHPRRGEASRGCTGFDPGPPCGTTPAGQLQPLS